MMQFIMQLLVVVPFILPYTLHMLGFLCLFIDFKREDSGIC